MDSEYDVIVLGGGSTGENVAQRTVQGGLSTLLVEEELVGGDCSYWACMPSKALLRPLSAVAEARAVDGAHQAMTGTIDTAAVLRRRDSFTHSWNDESQVQWLQSTSIDLLRGHGRLAGERRVDVVESGGATSTLRARHAVAVCVGSRPSVPPVAGLAEVHPWTSRDATSSREVPRRLAIIGGGVVACEMATAWRGLGAQEVTILQRAGRLLAGVEDFAAEAVAGALRASGVQVRTGVELRSVARGDAGTIAVTLHDGETVRADVVLVAAGRAPKTDDIGLDTVGLAPGSWLDVDDSMRVSAVTAGWLYAAGDCNHRALLTHMGKYQARACGDAIVARARGELGGVPGSWTRYSATADHTAIPQVVFTDPEIASVGLTSERARAAGMHVRTVDYEMGNVAGASVYADGYTGHARMVVDEDRRVVVGATFVGPAAGDQLHAATVAVVGEVPLERLWHAVPAYPTISEIWLRLLETYGL